MTMNPLVTVGLESLANHLLPASLLFLVGQVAWPVMPIALVAGFGLAGIAWRSRRLRHTTLRAVWWWSFGAFSAVAAVELLATLAGSRIDHSLQPSRYAAAMLTFCPMMAVLGAKRPQSRTWQWIVLSLWFILLIPAIQWWLYRPSNVMHVFTAWKLFLLVQLVIGLVNYLPTRYWASALLATAGQVLLVSKHLPLVGFSLPVFDHIAAFGQIAMGPLLGLTALASAAWMVHLADLRHRRPSAGIDHVWIDFRDLFGVVWAMRVGQQINTYSAMYGWHISLQWSGLRWIGPEEIGAREIGAKETVDVATTSADTANESQMSEQTAAALRKSLRGTLRRFVPAEWIAERLETEAPVAPPK